MTLIYLALLGAMLVGGFILTPVWFFLLVRETRAIDRHTKAAVLTSILRQASEQQRVATVNGLLRVAAEAQAAPATECCFFCANFRTASVPPAGRPARLSERRPAAHRAHASLPPAPSEPPGA